MIYSAFSTYSCITYEFFNLSKLLGGGGQNDVFAPQYFHWGGGGGRLPPCPPGSTPLVCVCVCVCMCVCVYVCVSVCICIWVVSFNVMVKFISLMLNIQIECLNMT